MSLDLNLLDALMERGADLNALDVMDHHILDRIVPKNSQEIPSLFDTTFPWDQNVVALLKRGAKIPQALRATIFECIHTLHPAAVLAISDAVAEHDRQHLSENISMEDLSVSNRRRM